MLDGFKTFQSEADPKPIPGTGGHQKGFSSACASFALLSAGFAGQDHTYHKPLLLVVASCRKGMTTRLPASHCCEAQPQSFVATPSSFAIVDLTAVPKLCLQQKRPFSLCRFERRKTCQSEMNQVLRNKVPFNLFASAQLVSAWMSLPEGLGQRHKKLRLKPGRFLLQSTREKRFQ